MTNTTARVGNGRAVHLSTTADGHTTTFCGAEGGRGSSMGTWVTVVNAPVTCRRCSPAAAAAPAPRAAAPAAPAPSYDRRAFLTAAAARLEAEGDTERAAWARAELAAL